MNMHLKTTTILTVMGALVGAAAPAHAQLIAAQNAPVAYGHHHLNVTDVEAHKKFWTQGLGGTAIKVGTSPAEIIRFPNVLVFLNARTPTGGTKGTTVNHLGFGTPDIRAAVDRLKAAGYPIVTRAELPASIEVKDDLGLLAGGGVVAFVMGPDETKVELVENRSQTQPIAMHHVHFAVSDGAAVQAWYAKTFGAKPGTRIGQPAADLPGVNLTFGPTPAPVVATRGRVLDHIGFEVKNLEEMCRQLEASGIKLDRPYTKVPALGIAVAFLTDPWGTYIELTEGLAAVP